MATKYYALLTNVGAAKLANATALGEQVEITQMAVGDGNGALPTPNPAQTALVHELRRAPLNTLTIDPVNTNQIIAEQVIPEDVGGWWIREIGLYDSDGDMIAVANCAETYKPLLQEGSGRMQVIRVILIVSSTQAVTLKIDPSVVLATRQYVDDQIIQVKAFVDQQLAAHIAAADPHKQYAPKASPALTGTPTAPTAAQTVNNTQIATTGFVKSAIAALVASSPAALDTLNELAAALGNDPNFATTVTNALAGKQPLDSTLTDLSGKTVNGILQYLQLGEAAKRDVGTGANQIPDMSAWKFQESADRTKHCWTFPSGWMIQHISANALSQNALTTSSWLVPFPERCITAWHADGSSGVLDLNSTASGVISAGRTYHVEVTTTTIQTCALGGHEIFGIGR
ncbi:phage tail protein [Citrobacter braakii]|uniref:phage tail protein n=1 Tax=Citrobacter braakii TaxID=57706 RepID=UPI0023B24E63|nr:phage tail protein [Citrobacter braakii]MDE9582452.1 phage tail protein [Citrobacter braakii]